MIQIHQLTKSYGNKKGVFDLSFEVSKGEVFGYLGPNGAGKTTTIRHLLGFIKPDQGSCKIDGMDCHREAAIIQKNLGYLPGEIAFFDDMTGIQFLNLMASMRGLKDFTRRDELIAQFELDTKGKIRKMSKGMKQKVGIVCAFMHNPDILILDEPTSGLDPLMQNRFIELIREEKTKGRTIIMSSHSFEEVERTCDRVGIIRQGRLVAIDDIQALKAAQRKLYRVTFKTTDEASKFAKENLTVESMYENIVNVAISGDLSQFIALLPNYSVTGLDVITQSLEDIFMHYYGREGSK
ncbi:ABC transporter ATP-binding protein [Alkaliphilus transvaalensis]|uniref:ABC transporter ATP-binding protein n=1 Tax=Alkaliphilus transvaalensis TaxID=114628 RepID=UPI00047BF888|nr:ABC transporter ATP-binding protein [Alkaliphilus transvaalensis]